MSKVRISVIIVSYEVRELLLACLRSIESSPEKEKTEVIVVDNNSSDGSPDAVQQQFPGVKLIRNRFNAGFSGANNQGMSIASGEYFFLLNPDTELIGDAMIQMEQYLDMHPECVLAGPQLLNSDGTLQISAWKNHRVSDLFLEMLYLHKIIHPLDYPRENFNNLFAPRSLSGAALFFRKSLPVQIGMLDERLFWMEDMDFCYRAERFGTLAYLPRAKVIHHSGQSQRKNYNMAISNQLLSKLKYYNKHFGFLSRLSANLICFVFISSRILAFSLSAPFGRIYRLKAKAYFYSMSRFFRYVFLNDLSLV